MSTLRKSKSKKPLKGKHKGTHGKRREHTKRSTGKHSGKHLLLGTMIHKGTLPPRPEGERMVTTEEMIESLVDACIESGFFEVQKRVLAEKHDGACINATWIGLEVLRHLGVEASPSAWDAMVVNEEARLLMLQGVPVSDWPDTAWSLGVNSKTVDSEGVGFHLVIQVQEGILDLSALQFNRPSKGINVPPALFVSMQDFNGKDIHVENEGTHYFLYNKRTKTPKKMRSAKGFSPMGMLGNMTNQDWVDMILLGETE